MRRAIIRYTPLGVFILASAFLLKTGNVPKDGHITDQRYYQFTRTLRPFTQYYFVSGSIFFHETSSTNALNTRQACAVESAAKMNPNTKVYILMTSSSVNVSNEIMKQLIQYPNIDISSVNLSEYFARTPLEEWYISGALNTSMWPLSHTSDALRYLTLWKFGGTYLDLDVVVMKSLEGLKNYVGAQDSEIVAAGVMNFEPGYHLASACLENFRKKFKGTVWGHNGPAVISRVLQSVCKVKKVEEMTRERCGNFTVYPPVTFYPIPYTQWRFYFNENGSNNTMSRLKDSYAIHVWNYLSAKEKVIVGSKQPYSLIAQKYCPKVYSNSGRYF